MSEPWRRRVNNLKLTTAVLTWPAKPGTPATVALRRGGALGRTESVSDYTGAPGESLDTTVAQALLDSILPHQPRPAAVVNALSRFLYANSEYVEGARIQTAPIAEWYFEAMENLAKDPPEDVPELRLEEDWIIEPGNRRFVSTSPPGRASGQRAPVVEAAPAPTRDFAHLRRQQEIAVLLPRTADGGLDTSPQPAGSPFLDIGPIGITGFEATVAHAIARAVDPDESSHPEVVNELQRALFKRGGWSKILDHKGAVPLGKISDWYADACAESDASKTVPELTIDDASFQGVIIPEPPAPSKSTVEL